MTCNPMRLKGPYLCPRGACLPQDALQVYDETIFLKA